MLPRIRELVEKYSTKEQFLARVMLYFKNTRLFEVAYDETNKGFTTRGIKRDGGLPYISHPLAVAVILLEYLHVRDEHIILAALLHDNMEDLGWTHEYISAVYGSQVAELVLWNTKPDLSLFEGDTVERDKAHHARLCLATYRAMLIKLADRLHNLMTLKVHPHNRQRRKIDETRSHYLHYAEQHIILVEELKFVLKEAEQNLGNLNST